MVEKTSPGLIGRLPAVGPRVKDIKPRGPRQEIARRTGSKVPEPEPDTDKREPLSLSQMTGDSEQDTPRRRYETKVDPFRGSSAASYRNLTFLDKTGSIAGILQKLETLPRQSRNADTERGIAIIREHLFLVMELERIVN